MRTRKGVRAMLQIRNYRLEVKIGTVTFFVINLESSNCPLCQMLLFVRGTRKRVFYKSEEEKITLIIRRLYCENCKRIHHELPDCIVPYKRYGAEVIENIVNGKGAEAPCPEGTVKRIRGWWKAVVTYFLNIQKTLEEKLPAEFSKPPAFREIVRAVANSNHWVFAHQV